MKLSAIIIGLICLVSQASYSFSAHFNSQCAFKKLIDKKIDTGVLLYEYQIAATIALSDQLAENAKYLEQRKSLIEIVNTDPFYLLNRQRNIFAKAYGEPSREVERFNLLIDRRVGEIRNINCLESLLFARHNERFPLLSSHQEFSAYIFVKDRVMRVLLSITRKPRIGAPLIESWQEKVSVFIDDGWNFYGFLHNHPFFLKSKSSDIAGTVIPSDPDIKTINGFMEAYGLDFGIITNGISTATYDSDDIEMLMRNVR
ncbi:MAG: hypothetical protein CMP10_01780 [Zetaproteobacteria bacterium]|nr:hypothetical protein [Pseudobdellovibrionaceae bacterium]